MAILLLWAGNAAASGNKPKNCPPPPTPDDVTIQGVVEVLNDALYQPYAVSAGVSIPAGQISGSVTFDVPAGKRLIVETITVQVSTLSGVPRVFFEPLVGGTRMLSLLSVASNGPDSFGANYFIGTHPFKARIDGTAESLDELRIRGGPGTLEGGSLNATVYGYLVDL